MRVSPIGAIALLATIAACQPSSVVVPVAVLPAPTGLVYELDPVGSGSAPAGILLRWDPNYDASLAAWNIYSRGATTDPYVLRGTTTSPTFHDDGVPHLQYYVTAVDVNGGESAPSLPITVDERLMLPAPLALNSTSLNGAVLLEWTDNAYTSTPDRFKDYRVYSASYDLDQNLCGVDWVIEGTTVAPEYLVGALTNGVPRCYGVSAVSLEGYESLWSPLRSDNPRPDAKNVVLYARQFQDAGSGFRFWLDSNHDGLAQPAEVGVVTSASSGLADFVISRDASNRLYLTPTRVGTGMQVYGAVPVDDLSSIDYAPPGGYGTAALEALPGWGYVAEMPGPDGFARYGAVRVSHVGTDFLILDWSYQTDPGNPELTVVKH
ncbi:MAG: hypothetical protein ACHQ2E_01270 [Gemmatimonadales bacterium]